MISLDAVTVRLADELQPTARSAQRWLQTHEAHPVSSKPASLTVAQALRLWRVRQPSIGDSSREGALEELLGALQELAPQKRIEQYAFRGENGFVSLLFQKFSGKYVGAVIVQR